MTGDDAIIGGAGSPEGLGSSSEKRGCIRISIMPSRQRENVGSGTKHREQSVPQCNRRDRAVLRARAQGWSADDLPNELEDWFRADLKEMREANAKPRQRRLTTTAHGMTYKNRYMLFSATKPEQASRSKGPRATHRRANPARRPDCGELARLNPGATVASTQGRIIKCRCSASASLGRRYPELHARPGRRSIRAAPRRSTFLRNRPARNGPINKSPDFDPTELLCRSAARPIALKRSRNNRTQSNATARQLRAESVNVLHLRAEPIKRSEYKD